MKADCHSRTGTAPGARATGELIQRLRDEVSALTHERDALLNQVDALRGRIAELEGQNAALEQPVRQQAHALFGRKTLPAVEVTHGCVPNLWQPGILQQMENQDFLREQRWVGGSRMPWSGSGGSAAPDRCPVAPFRSGALS